VTRTALLLALLPPVLLAGCNKPDDSAIEAVPTPSAQSANDLMVDADRAAASAQARSNAIPAVPPSSSNAQGNSQ
jgi:hypothetical protein